MDTGYRFALWTVVVLLAIPAVAAAQAVENWEDVSPLSAQITLGRSPEPPDCAQPQSAVDMSWNITYSSTPSKVIFTIRDPNGATVDSTYYPDSSGVNIARQWNVPASPVFGKYWVRVEFHSLDAGHESTAEVSFYVCSGIGEICVKKWVDGDCDGIGSDGDYLMSGWWVCMQTPWGDVFCDTTGLDGRVCWRNLPRGDYTVYEQSIAWPWIAISPTSYNVTISDQDSTWSGNFFNVNYDDCYGACCKCDGGCEEVTPDVCAQIGYRFFGLGTRCIDVTCYAGPSAVDRTSWGAMKDKYR